MAQVRTRKRGKTFSYIFEAGKSPEGKRKVVEKGGFATKAEAYKAGVAAYNDFLHGNIGITSEKITLKDFMTAWLDNVVALNVKPSSMQTYRLTSHSQIIPYLGEVKVQELTPAMLDAWIRKLAQAGLAKNTLSATHALIYSALKYAVYPAQLISLNPAAYIEVPKNAPQNVVERHIITHKHFATLLEKYPFGTPYYIPLLLLYHTGARLGEVLGLIWSDVNFETKRITLRQQITYISKRGHFFTTLKTKSSNRYIIVDDFLLGELKRWQNRDGKLRSQKIIPSRQKNYRSEVCERFFVCRKSLRIKHCALRITDVAPKFASGFLFVENHCALSISHCELLMSLRSLRAVFCLSKIIAH